MSVGFFLRACFEWFHLSLQSLVRVLESCAGTLPCHSLILFQDLLVSSTLSPVWFDLLGQLILMGLKSFLHHCVLVVKLRRCLGTELYLIFPRIFIVKSWVHLFLETLTFMNCVFPVFVRMTP